jgi:hypothetical protein
VHDFEPRDFVTGKLLDEVYECKHQLIFVFTNDSTHANIPKPCREWMLAIDDSLDEKVDEAKYTNPSIQTLFGVIEKDKITPEERARMKEEYNREEAKTQAFKKGELKGIKETAHKIKALGTLTDEQIASGTGLTLEMVKTL